MEKQSERTVDITVPARLAPRIVEGWKRIDRYEPVLKRALETYGFPAQAAQLTEEVGELLAVLNQYRRGRATAQAVKTELADVAIMVMQMEMHICGDEEGIADELDAKMARLEKRLEVGEAHAQLVHSEADQQWFPTDVDGFRVGDLVVCGVRRWVPVSGFYGSVNSGHRGLVIVEGEAIPTRHLTRKHVEVGDWVRTKEGRRGEVLVRTENVCRIFTGDEMWDVAASGCVVIAPPTVKT